MSRNITVTVPDELSEKMNTMTDVNWSGVTRDCIERYIEARTNPPVADAIIKMVAKKSVDYKEGFNFVVDNIDKIEVATLEEIAFGHGENTARDLDKLVRMIDYNLGKQLFGCSGEDEDNCHFYWLKSLNFIQGMEEAASKIVVDAENYTHDGKHSSKKENKEALS